MELRKKNTNHTTLIKDLTCTIIASKSTKNHHFALVHAGKTLTTDKKEFGNRSSVGNITLLLSMLENTDYSTQECLDNAHEGDIF